MAKCYFCGKTSTVASKRKKLRGRYNPTGKRWKKPNLQWFRLPSRKRVKACTKCIKTFSKSK